jgi:hypothetical protein
MEDDAMNQEAKFPAVLPRAMTAADLASLGSGEIAYIRPLKALDVKKLFPQLTGIPEGIDLFAVYTADGTPMALTDTLNAAIANVRENDLSPVQVH